MSVASEPIGSADDRAQCADASPAFDQEHDQQLVFHGLGWLHPRENLPGHHSRSDTTPTAAIELMIGMKPLRRAPRVIGSSHNR